MAKKQSKYLQGKRIDPRPITGDVALADLVDETFMAYNAARLREACQLFTRKMLEPDVTVGLSITGALTPAGLGISALIPLMRAGFVDWIISTGANLYHDTHFGIGLALHQGSTAISDVMLREEEVVRIYDIFFDYSVLLDTDAFFRRLIEGENLSDRCARRSSTICAASMCASASAHWDDENKSLLAAAYELRRADLHLVAPAIRPSG